MIYTDPGEHDVKSSFYLWTSCIILMVAILLRVVLGYVNQEANDDHIEVIRPIAFEGRLPERSECFECFQPKFYHTLAALTWRILGIDTTSDEIKTANLISSFAGIFTLLVVFNFLKRLYLSNNARLLLFAMVASNPDFIGINSQATNDSLVALFGAIALYFAFLFYNEWHIHDLIFSVAFCILGVLTKMNAIVVFIAVMSLLFASILKQDHKALSDRARLVPSFLACLAFFTVFVAGFGNYYQHYLEYGSPFVSTRGRDKDPFPSFNDNEYYHRPGTVSIMQSFLRFRVVELIKEPVIDQSGEVFPWHRTSLWSQLYGRLNFVHFSQWPPSWSNTTPFVLNLGRALLILGLIPIIFLVMGLIRSLIYFVAWVVGKLQVPQVQYSYLLLVLTSFGYLTFIVLYNAYYRDFSNMKAIYLLPGLLAFLGVVASALQYFYMKTRGHIMIQRLLELALGVLCVLYLIDIGALLRDLMA